MSTWGRRWAMLLVVVLLGSGCAAEPAGSSPPARAVPVLAGAHNDTTTPFNLSSLPALARHRYDGRDLRLEAQRAHTLAFTSHAVSYRSGDLRITGVMDVPTRPGRHPLVVLAHGWTDPEDYESGDQLGRERALLASSGFVALQIDYRNHAGSSRESTGPVRRPLGYPEDLVNAVRAVRRARLPFVDAERVGLFGRSMGGGVVLNALAARPGLAQAAVLYAPVSSSAADGYRRWVRDEPGLRARVKAAYGTPATRPGLWRSMSARGYLGRVQAPVLVAHGTADPVCPVRWSRATVAALPQAVLEEYPGEDHGFGDAWGAMMRRAVGHFQRYLV